jgi:hypothetical protein
VEKRPGGDEPGGDEPGEGRAGGDWRPGLIGWATALLAAYGSHGWSLEATTGRRPIGPNELAWMEAALAEMPDGLTGAERLDLVATVAGHVRMIAGQAGGAESDLMAAMGIVLREHAESYPAVVAAVSDVAAHGGGDDAFAFGLNRILDGLEVLLRSRQRV